jgi:ABC-type dipeptide/oligopeptide/nickel transport system ATPase component
VGEAGTGKSYTAVELVNVHGEDNIYIMGEYEKGWDKYNGEQILFLDELRSQLKYEQLTYNVSR